MISTTTVMGGKNSFLGIAYVVVGGLCIMLGVVFSVTQLVKPRYVRERHSSALNKVDISGQKTR